MLYNALMAFCCGPQDEWSGWVSQCGGKCKKQSLHSICMEKDATAASEAYIKRPSNLTVFNFGQHFCAGSLHRTYREYQLHVDRIVSTIGNMSAHETRRLAWHETNMMPFRTDSWIQAYGDQRTNTKLRVYNWYATKEMQGIGIPVIPAFAQTLPLFSGSADDAHIPVEFIRESSLKFVLLLVSEGDAQADAIRASANKTT